MGWAIFALVFASSCFVIGVIGVVRDRRTPLSGAGSTLARGESAIGEAGYEWLQPMARLSPWTFLTIAFFFLGLTGLWFVIELGYDSRVLVPFVAGFGVAWLLATAVAFCAASLGRPTFLLNRALRRNAR